MLSIGLIIPAIVIAYLLWTFVAGAGYEPVPSGVLDKMIEMTKPSEGFHVYDLGSGFGRIVLTVARRTGAQCTGVEVDPLKVWWSRRQVRQKGLSGRVNIVRSNLLDVDLSDADSVFVFLWEGLMEKLKPKVLKEMKPGSSVVSYYHRFKGWKPEQEDRIRKICLYRVGVQHLKQDGSETPDS